MKISLKKKKLASGKYSLFIEYYKGTYVDEKGITKHNREFEYLKRYLIIDPSSRKEKKDNKESLEFCEAVLAIRKADFHQGKYGIKDSFKEKTNFLSYFAKLRDEKYTQNNNNINQLAWHSAEQHLKRFCPPYLAFSDVTVDFLKGFKQYLDIKAKSKGGLPLAQSTKQTYFNKLKACVNQAFDEGYIDKKITNKIKGFANSETQREYLTQDELQAVASTPCRYEVLKRAFIFSCLSGLRWSDINKMLWSEVRDEGRDPEGNEIYRVIFKQQKTDGQEYLYLSKQARDLLGKRGDQQGRVFVGLNYSSTTNNALLRWLMKAGITKKITFHCARHTNAVLLLENGADLYTVQKRLGHKEIRTTAIYAKIIDKKMKEAANLIPNLNIQL